VAVAADRKVGPASRAGPGAEEVRLGSPGLRIAGERIYLRPVLESDVSERYLCWMRDPDVTRYLECRFTSCTLDDLRRFVAEANADPDALFLAIVLKKHDRHVGNLKLAALNRIHGSAEIGLLIGEKNCWNEGYATEAIRLVMAHAFSELGLHKLTAGCYDVNPASARAFLRAGFVREGLRREQFECEGRRVGQILLGATRKDFCPVIEE
jgi:RimJ/RimL family protein N-acetyltransferase